MSQTIFDIDNALTESDNQYKQFLANLKTIKSNVKLFNESTDNDKEDGDDLDALLKGSGEDDADGGGAEDNLDDNASEQDGGDANDEFDDSEGEEDSDAKNNSEDDDLNFDDNDSENKDSFETDNQGLMDTITKLTKQGHEVKIVVSAEGKQTIESVDGKKIKSLKQLNEMFTNKNKPLSTKGRVNMNKNGSAAAIKALMEQVNTLNKEIKLLKNNSQPKVQEEKFIKIKESDYNALIEMAEDMNFKIDEQDMIIKNYNNGNYNNFLNNNLNENNMLEDIEMNQILDELDQSIEQLNKISRNNEITVKSDRKYNKGVDNALTIMSETIIPHLNNINAAKTCILNEMDLYDIIKTKNQTMRNTMISARFDDYINEHYDPYNYKSNENINNNNNMNTLLESSVNMMMLPYLQDQFNDRITAMNKITTIEECANLISDKIELNKDVISAINEATSDISITDSDFEYPTNYTPAYQPFHSYVSKLINSAASGYKAKSMISDDTNINDDFGAPTNILKYILPVMSSEKLPENKITIKSAISNLSESLIDFEGNINIDFCKKAYLYHRVNNPKTLKDFAMPIAVYNKGDNKLYAHPTLIKNAANILKNDSCMKTYDIPNREKLYELRESLEPYMEAIELDIPWK